MHTLCTYTSHSSPFLEIPMNFFLYLKTVYSFLFQDLSFTDSFNRVTMLNDEEINALAHCEGVMSSFDGWDGLSKYRWVKQLNRSMTVEEADTYLREVIAQVHRDVQGRHSRIHSDLVVR
jgi:hypothetical protein